MKNKLFIDWKFAIGIMLAIGAVIAAYYAKPRNTPPSPKAPTSKLEVKLISETRYDGDWYGCVEIEGCEYIMVRSHMENGIVHKGNCSNPIHQGEIHERTTHAQ